MKKILIVGNNSYIGESFKTYIKQWPERYFVEDLETIGLKPTKELFYGFDVIFCVTGIAHIKETSENKHLYYEINRELVVEIARNAKESGVKQFILLSSMSVYGLDEGFITKETNPNPKTAYGESKLQADEKIKEMEDVNFIFSCLRPPMVYGKNCKGNYQILRKFALHFPIFPKYKNQRSMIYIGNLCEFVKKVVDQEASGLFFPQNAEYVDTSKMVDLIASLNGKKISLPSFFNWLIKITPLRIFKKVFGDLVYEKVDIVEKYNFIDSIKQTEL